METPDQPTPTQSTTPLAPPTEPTEPNFGPTHSSGMATTSLVLGIIGFFTSCLFVGLLPGIAALITGIIAIGQIDNPANNLHGRGKATTGAILGGTAILLAIILPLLIGILLPALGAARRTARQMQNNTQVRGVHQAMVLYAQSNKSYYPGIDLQGEVVDASPAGRLQLLLEGNYFTGEYLINPADGGMTAWTSGQLLPTEYSYAVLDIAAPGGRRDEWRDTLNADAAVLSDRNTGMSGDPVDLMSVFTDTPGDWRGGVAWNDNHVVFETDAILSTQYGDYPRNPNDNLFEAAGTNDAMMIHNGQ